MKNIFSCFLALLCLASLSSANAQTSATALQGGFVDKADLLVFMNIRQMNASPFVKAMEAQQTPEQAALQKEKQEKFTAATGLDEKDIVAMVISADLKGVDFEGKTPPDMEQLPLAFALQLDKAVTMEQVAAGLRVIAEDQLEGVDLLPSQVDGLPVLVVKPKEEPGPGEPKQFYATLSNDGKNVLLGFNLPVLKDGLARIAAGTVSKPSPEMDAAMRSMGSRPLRLAFVFPAKLREMIARSVQEAAAGEMGPMASMFTPMGNARSFLVSADMKENMDLNLSIDVGDPAQAQALSGSMQGMMGMALMGMGQMLGPNAMGMMNKIKFGNNAGVATVGVVLSPEDLKIDPNTLPPGMMMDMEGAEGGF